MLARFAAATLALTLASSVAGCSSDPGPGASDWVDPSSTVGGGGVPPSAVWHGPQEPSGLGPPQPPGGVLLDAHGGLHPFGGVKLDTTNAASWPNDDLARALVVRSDGSGGWVLDAWGAIHAFGSTPAIQSAFYQQGKDVARALVVLQDEKGAYILDANGAIHEMGGAPPLASGASWNFDIARGLDVHLDALGAPDGGWLLDGWGGMHKFGAAPDIGNPPYYSGYDLWSKIHAVGGGAYVIGRWGIVQPIGTPSGIPFDNIPDYKDQDIVRDIVPVTPTGAWNGARSLDCPTAGTYCGFDGIPGAKNVLYECSAKGGPPPKVSICDNGCAVMPPGQPDYCHGIAQCSLLQWWNQSINYGPYVSYGWWDTDLNVSSSHPVQLRHDSRLTKHGVYAWGYMPEFVDLVTGKNFRFLHLRPQNQYATNDGQVYPAGFVVGLSGGDTADTGLGTYSTGAHLCVQTLDTWGSSFPGGNDPCK
jgi:hypothetical protein